MDKAVKVNPWFITALVHQSLRETARLLTREILEKWTGRYPERKFQEGKPAEVGTIMAGNIPLAGFHDFLSILLSGHILRGKLSGKDDRLLPFLADKLLEFEPRFSPFIHFEKSYLRKINAMIATGSNNSFRYFEYYFGKYPHIFRKNRNGAAILHGNETAADLAALAEDVFLYFGLGCRNVAKIYVPLEYRFDELFREMEKYKSLVDHHKYANNYLYNRSVFLMNRVEHLDTGFLLLREDHIPQSPVGTLHYERYENKTDLQALLKGSSESVQCIAGPETPGIQTVGFGQTQHPELWDYADDVDTLNFLINLSEN